MERLSERDEETLRELEESMWRAETRFDRNHMEAVLAPDFFEYKRSGKIYARDDTLAVPAEPIRAKLPLEGWAVGLIDEQTALVTYVSEVEYGDVLRANRSSI
jgi:hypothetical protein